MPDNYGVPEIFDNEARGQLRYTYDDIKFVLKVPIVNFIFRAWAYYDKFLELAWCQMRNNMLTNNAEDAANELRQVDISVNVPKIDLYKLYPAYDAEMIRKIIFTFQYVNPKLLLIASSVAESLSSRPIPGSEIFDGYILPGIMPGLPHINFVNIEDVPVGVRKIFEDITDKHHAFDIASDFRALANYPDFLSSSWSILKTYVGTDEYNLLNMKIKSKSIELAHRLPFSVTLNRQILEHHYSLTDIAGIMGLVSMFQNFLPSLIIDMEYLRRMIS